MNQNEGRAGLLAFRRGGIVRMRAGGRGWRSVTAVLDVPVSTVRGVLAAFFADKAAGEAAAGRGPAPRKRSTPVAARFVVSPVRLMALQIPREKG
jgi:hypothetical protein